MEIHELNTFVGTLGATDFFATDNGTDTSKVSAAAIIDPLNERIDNIIAGPASSAQEVIDARMGDDGVTYSSLGAAIRDQFEEIKSDSVNLLNPYKINAAASGVTVSPSRNGVKVQNTTAGTYKDARIEVQLEPNTQYTISCIKKTNSGAGAIGYAESTDGGSTYPSSITQLIKNTGVDDRLLTATFTTTTGYVRFRLFSTYSSSAIGDVDFIDLMLVKGPYPGYFVPCIFAYDSEARTKAGSAYAMSKTLGRVINDIEQGNANRLVVKDLPVKKGDIISFKAGSNVQQIKIEYYSYSTGLYVYETGWLNSMDQYLIEQDGYIWIRFRRSNDSAITPADYDATTIYMSTSANADQRFSTLENGFESLYIKKSDIIQGAYNRDGSVAPNTTRIRLKDFVDISVGDVISFKAGANAEGVLCCFVNDFMQTIELPWVYGDAEITSAYSGHLMLLFRRESNADLGYPGYDAEVVIKRKDPYYQGSEKYNGDMFRCNYADSIPYPVRNSNTYSVTYADMIAKYDGIRNRLATLYSNVSSLVPKPVTATKTALRTTDSGYTLYKYTFTPAYPKKTVFLIAGTHGNEYEGIYSLYNLIKAIYADGYTYPQLRKIRENVKVVIIPVVNPYGFEHNTKLNADGLNIFDYYSSTSESQPKEMLSIKDVFESETLDYFMDMHTDPYNATSAKGCYGYALVSGSSFEPLYEVIMRFREILYNEFNFSASFISGGSDVIVGRIESINSTGSTGYAERRGIPATLIEISTGYGWGGAEEDGSPANFPSFAPYGSSEMMRICTDFYTNVIKKMVEDVLGL